MGIQDENRIVCWWSGGITSAVACSIAIDLYGLESCIFIMQDTGNEHEDTYRFKKDCEQWYGKEIETISAIGDKYSSIKDVWYKYKSMNVAHGAICSSELKREVRKRWQSENEYKHQVFGFDASETNRAISMRMNYPDARAIFPLLFYSLKKKDCIQIIEDAGIEIPKAYQLGFHNNNCLKTGCVQGGIGYWQKYREYNPEGFAEMAKVEHELTDLKGRPVTMLKDQGKEAKDSGNTLVFLLPHPDYPSVKDLSMMKGRPPMPLFECNGFCGTNDLSPRTKTESEINFQEDSPQLSMFQ